jgi:hypothetical protein
MGVKHSENSWARYRVDYLSNIAKRRAPLGGSLLLLPVSRICGVKSCPIKGLAKKHENKNIAPK